MFCSNILVLSSVWNCISTCAALSKLLGDNLTFKTPANLVRNFVRTFPHKFTKRFIHQICLKCNLFPHYILWQFLENLVTRFPKTAPHGNNTHFRQSLQFPSISRLHSFRLVVKQKYMQIYVQHFTTQLGLNHWIMQNCLVSISEYATSVKHLVYPKISPTCVTSFFTPVRQPF